jgi:kynureninase
MRDAADPLALSKVRLALPNHVIYLDSNSLGALAFQLDVAAVCGCKYLRV